VAIQFLPHDFVHAVVHHSRRIGIALTFALLARTVRRGSWRVAIVTGVAGGISILACYAVAFFITDRLIK
jgi:hypothetical protein